jgi:hypothetical protein
MTPAARKVLEMSLTLPGCDGFPQHGWEHGFTGIGETGGTFYFDHPDGHGIKAETPAPGIVHLVKTWTNWRECDS